MMVSIFAYWPFVQLLVKIVYADPLPIFKLDFLNYWVVRVIYIFKIQVPFQISD